MSELKPINEGFVGLLDNVDKGAFRDEVDAALKSLVAAIQDTGKGGKLMIEVSLSPNKNTGVIEVTPTVKAKEPAQRKFASMFFVTPENGLSRYDSRQRDMFRETGSYNN